MTTSSQPSRLPRLQRKPALAEMEAMLDMLPSAAMLVDARNRQIQMANSKAAEMTSYTRSEMVGMRLTSLFDKLDEAAFWDASGGSLSRLELVVLRRNKSRLEVVSERSDLGINSGWSMVSLTPLHHLRQKKAFEDRHGEMIASMHTLSQALKQPELNTALEMILTAASDITRARILSIYLQDVGETSAAPEIVRYAHLGPPEPLPGSLPAQELVHLRNPHLWTPGKRPATSLHRSARAGSLGFVATVPLGQPKALIGFLLAASDSAVGSEAILQQLMIIAEVISGLIESHSRQNNMLAMLKNEQNLGSIYQVIENSVEDGLVVLSNRLNILHINAAAERMLGYTRSEAAGRPVQDILISNSSLKPTLQLALQGTPTLKEETQHFYRRSGQPFHARMSVLPTRDHSETTGIVILFQDLSDQEQIQVQAQQLEQRATLGDVMAIFAHEVRNPINNISTGLQLMAYNLGQEDPNQVLIGRLQQDCDRLTELMKSVLAFSRPTEYEMEAVDLRLLVQRLVERLRPRMLRSRVEPLLQAEPTLPKVRGNARALEQVFTNLITNAIQAMNETGGTVAIKLQPVRGTGDRTQVQVDVADNGPGISRELQDRLFQPFFTTKMDGTGLGLPITKRIITAHKGTIQVTSFPGGTVFHVTLPAMETA